MLSGEGFSNDVLTIMVISLRSVIMFVRSAQLEVFNVCVDTFLD